MIVVLHRERSEKLAREFVAVLHIEDEAVDAWPDLPAADQEKIVRAFDSLIQDGLIGEREPRPAGRE